MAPARQSLFFALLPPPELAQQVAQATAGWRATLGLSGRPMEPERLHLTLIWVAPEASPATIETLRAVAERVHMPPTPVRLDRLGRFERRAGRPAPVVLLSSNPSALPQLLALQQQLQEAVQAAGFPARVTPRYQPHMTLLHDRRPVPIQSVGPYAWTASEFVLVRSHIGLRHYDILGHWPLRTASA